MMIQLSEYTIETPKFRQVDVNVFELGREKRWQYDYSYSYKGDRQYLCVERKRQLRPNLIDAAIDGEMVRRHGSILRGTV